MLKSEAINQAYADIRISGLTSEQVPEETEIAVRELDQLMFRWGAIGRDVNYNYPQRTDDDALVVSDPNEILGVYDWAIQGVISALAVKLVNYFGKSVPADLAGKARSGLNTIMVMTVKLKDQPYPNRMPIGSGNYRHSGVIQRFYRPTYQGRVAPQLQADGGVSDYEFDFSGDMVDGKTLASYELALYPTGVVTISNEVQDGNLVTFRVTAGGTTVRRRVLIECEGVASDGTTYNQFLKIDTIPTLIEA